MSDIHDECGVAAVYHLPSMDGNASNPEKPGEGCVSRLVPHMLQDIQNRGQLAAGLTSYNADRAQVIDTHRDVGSVSEVFKLSHQAEYEELMAEYAGPAAIGHVRYATCGKDDRGYAQPFERHHLQKFKWFSFGFNGQLANYQELRDALLHDREHHLARETDTEVMMHEISRDLAASPRTSLVEMMRRIGSRFDGAYSLVFLNAHGEMLVARDPLGIKPLCYAIEGPLFTAASESVPLVNLGIAPENIKPVPPGHAIDISDGKFDIKPFSSETKRAHCFFEWVYFANVASTLDGRGVYTSRTALGAELARLELEYAKVRLDDDTIVVPVPDTSKAAADSMAFELKLPSREGIIRNRYTGRTFIESGDNRLKKALRKYIPLREVLQGKRVFLVEDSIVRSTTMRVVLERMRKVGGVKEIHVRVACPPIIAPCFYGIDMSTTNELFACQFLPDGKLTEEAQESMAKELGADSLRYLPVESVAKCIGFDASELCQACITGKYPTPCGQRLYEVALDRAESKDCEGRTYEGSDNNGMT